MPDKNSTSKPDNIDFYDDHIELVLNPEIYTPDIIFSAAYILLDRAYIVLDKNLKNNYLVKLRPKGKNGSVSKSTVKQDLIRLADDFNDELLNYSVYKGQVERSAGLREIIYRAAMESNTGRNKPRNGAKKKK